MNKTIGELVDGLSTINIKIFYLVDKVQRNKHTRKDAKKIQDLNILRGRHINSINKHVKERQEIKV